MTGKVDLLTLPRVTPSKLGDRSQYQPRRRPDVNGIPDPRNPFRVTADAAPLKAFAVSAYHAHLAEIAPQDARDVVTGILLADVDRRYPPEEMAVCAKHGLTRRFEQLLVQVERFGRPEYFPLRGYGRDLPERAEAHRFTARSDEVGSIAQVPEIAMPLFDAIAGAIARRATEFDDVLAFPAGFNRKHQRPPTWAEIEQTFPRIGAWMANKRGDA